MQLPAEVQEVLAEAEEEHKEQQRHKAAGLWDGKMQATQSASAFGVGVL